MIVNVRVGGVTVRVEWLCLDVGLVLFGLGWGCGVGIVLLFVLETYDVNTEVQEYYGILVLVNVSEAQYCQHVRGPIL